MRFVQRLRKSNKMGSEAVKLLERMKASRSGWKRDQIDRLYEGFGFIIKSGNGPHDKVYHPDHPDLFAFVPRHTKVGEAYVENAIKLITRLQKREESKSGREDIERKSS